MATESVPQRGAYEGKKASQAHPQVKALLARQVLSDVNSIKETFIISVEKCYPTLAQRCYDMAEGQSVYLSPAEIPYDLHRYRDGWHAYWKSPPNGQIGRLLTSREELCFFLNGRWAVGRPLRNLIGLRKFLVEEEEKD